MFSTLILLGALAGADTANVAAPSDGVSCCEIVELRQYTLHPGRRDAFIPFFEREFIESQEAVGNTVIGQFRDLDDADHFTWLRGFADMPERAKALQAFYGGDLWKAKRNAANDFFIDTDNVLLLHAVRPKAAFNLAGMKRAEPGATHDPRGLLVATVYSFAAPVDAQFVEFFERHMRKALAGSGIDLRGYYASETTPNNFPRLPVREKEHVFVWFALYEDRVDYDRHRQRLEATAEWRDRVVPRLQQLASAPQILRLAPTPRSRLHD